MGFGVGWTAKMMERLPVLTVRLFLSDTQQTETRAILAEADAKVASYLSASTGRPLPTEVRESIRATRQGAMKRIAGLLTVEQRTLFGRICPCLAVT